MYLTVEVIKCDIVKEVQSKFDVGNFKHTDKKPRKPVEDNTSEKELMEPFSIRKDSESYLKDVYVDENGVYCYIVPHCSKCNSRHVTKHDYNEKEVTFADGKKRKIKVKRYKCKNCGKGSQVEFGDELKPYERISRKIVEMVRDINALRWISLGDVSRIFKITKGANLSREFIRKAQIITEKLSWRNSNITSSDYIAYDCQWVPVDDGWKYLHVLTDINKNQIIALKLTDDENKLTSKKFLKDNLRIGSAKAMVSDLKPGYREIANELGIKLQYCTRHFDRLLSRKIQKDLKKIKDKFIGKIYQENPNISDFELKELVDEELEDYVTEFYEYKHEIMNLFDIEEYDDAVKYIYELKSRSNEYPETLRKYMHDEFFSHYSNFILYKHKDFEGKIPMTNNISEQKIRYCATKYEKNKFRTPLGFFNHVVVRVNNQIKIKKSSLT